MSTYTLSSLQIPGVQPLQLVSDPVIESLLTDSRKLIIPATTLFFSIPGHLKNADQFIPALYTQGVRSFVVSREFKLPLDAFPEANILVCDEPQKALHAVSGWHRNKFNFPVIGITGSNGKTIVKEWLNQLLHHRYNIVRSPKSYNSQIGVPLSIWQMEAAHNLGIFEAGISMPGEMKKLQLIIKPDIGIFTFLGTAHAAGFTNYDQKIKEKLALFTESKVIIYCADESELHSNVLIFKETFNANLILFNWSLKPGSLLHVTHIQKKWDQTEVSLKFNNKSFSFIIPFTDEASIHNAITCCCNLLYLRIPEIEIINGLSKLKVVEMRLELKEGINNCSIINDSYSSDLDSLNIALDFLSQQHQHKNKVVVLSDMLQSGKPAEELYKQIGRNLIRKKISRIIGIGPEISNHRDAFNDLESKEFYLSTEAFMESFPSNKFHNETILIKGARTFGFEKISHSLEEKKHETVLEINLSALRHNLKLYKSQTNADVKLMAMVKAFSYGSGSFEIANVMQHTGVDYLAVAYADEGVELRMAEISLPVMVMNTEEGGFDNLIKYNLEPELYSFKITNAFISFLSRNEIENYPVHIKLDTGMHRLGFEQNDISGLTELLKSSRQIKVRSVFSHLAASGDKEHDAFTRQQFDAFLIMSAELEKGIGYEFIRHIANTSAIHRHSDMQLDMIRLGIGLYGVDSNEKVQSQLQNVTTLKTSVSQIKHIQKGESVGYSRKGIAGRETTIATVRLGYADGYPRNMSNGKGNMLVKGIRVPVIGNVCMDMTMIDITGLDVSEGDEVIVFGEGLPVTDIADQAETIPYEILTGISRRVKRVYFEE